MLKVEKEVKIIRGCSPSSVSQELLASDEPAILKGFSNEWPLVVAGKQSAEQAAKYLLRFYQNRPVKASYVAPHEKGRVFYNRDMTGFNFETKELDLRELLTDIFAQQDMPAPSTIYMASSGIDLYLPGLQDEVSVSSSLPPSIVNIWIGNQSRIAAHYDFAQNLACSVVGRRRFTLFPPEQVKNLYIGPLDKAPGGQEISTVDFFNVDLERFPKFEEALAAAQVAELEPGDALVLPSMWWHHVEGLDPFNVLLTHWWRDSPPYLGRPTNALLLAILSIRDLPPAQRAAWKSLFDHYVFDFQADNFEHIPDQAKSFLASPMDELSARKLRADLQNKLRR